MPVSEEAAFKMYNGAVSLVFKPNATKFRYTVTDSTRDEANMPVRGVTSLLRDIIAKPDLMTWPLNMSNKVLFGTKFDETLKEYVHDWSQALIQPNKEFTEDELHNFMMDGSREWTNRSDKGKDIGTMTHDAIDTQLKGGTYNWSQEEDLKENVKMAKKAVESFFKWWNEVGAEVVRAEEPVYSRSLNYAGTYDLIAKIKGKTYLLDIKTTNASKKAPMGIYAEYFLQLGAYSYALREETGVKVDDLGIVRVGKDGKLYVATATDIGLDRDGCERAFAFGVRLHDWLSTTTPYLTDRYFKSHLIQSDEGDTSDSKS